MQIGGENCCQVNKNPPRRRATFQVAKERLLRGVFQDDRLLTHQLVLVSGVSNPLPSRWGSLNCCQKADFLPVLGKIAHLGRICLTSLVNPLQSGLRCIPFRGSRSHAGAS